MDHREWEQVQRDKAWVVDKAMADLRAKVEALRGPHGDYEIVAIDDVLALIDAREIVARLVDVIEPLIRVDEQQQLIRDERATGWDRAHTMLCPEIHCRKHRNPWQRKRGSIEKDEREREHVVSLLISQKMQWEADLRAKVEVLPGNDPFQSPERRDAYEYAITQVLDLIDG